MTPVNVMPNLQPQQQQQQGIRPQPNLIDLALDLLPQDFELIPFLQVKINSARPIWETELLVS